MSEAAKFTPATQNFDLYDDGFPWSFDIEIIHPDIPDLTGYTITALFNPTKGDTPVELTITHTPESLLARTFEMGYNVPVRGKVAIVMQKSGGQPRTYIKGDVRMDNSNQVDF